MAAARLQLILYGLLILRTNSYDFSARKEAELV